MSRPKTSGLRHWLLPQPGLTLVLAGTWLLLVNRLSLGQLLLGLLLGLAIPRLTAAFWPEPVPLHRPLSLLRLVAIVIYDILAANLKVARVVLLRPRRLNPGFVEVPLSLRSELALTLLASTVSLTPGTVSAYLTPDRRTLVVHVLDLESPDHLVAELKTRYETPLQEIFEPC